MYTVKLGINNSCGITDIWQSYFPDVNRFHKNKFAHFFASMFLLELDFCN